VWNDVAKVATPVPGRTDWNGKNSKPIETFKTERKYTTQVLPRDKLASAMHHHILQCQRNGLYSNIELNYGYMVEPLPTTMNLQHQHLETETSSVLVNITAVKNVTVNNNDDSSQILAARLIVAADGSARTFANAMEAEACINTKADDNFRVVRYPDDNQRVYKNIAFRIPKDWRPDINYAVRTDRVIFDALPANDHGDYVGVLLLRKDDEMARANVDPGQFLDFLKEEIPQFVGFFNTTTTMASVARRPPSILPMFRYVTPRMHQDGQTILLGDCAHTVKPYFGLGANSALEDVKIFGECLDKYFAKEDGASSSDDFTQTLKRAVQDFSDRRSPDIETMVKVSHSLDRPGPEGLMTFLIPIILDGIFSKLAPQVFAPNIISMLQNEEITFQQAAERKRLDRMLQIALLVGVPLIIQSLR
jgi:2-polyprenyl-6-methoxyphenol hydroxylase-like FAD-dependent oxidoreductase